MWIEKCEYIKNEIIKLSWFIQNIYIIQWFKEVIKIINNTLNKIKWKKHLKQQCYYCTLKDCYLKFIT